MAACYSPTWGSGAYHLLPLLHPDGQRQRSDSQASYPQRAGLFGAGGNYRRLAYRYFKLSAIGGYDEKRTGLFCFGYLGDT